MISVILYGRNDAHGYNLHRRAALSLNCIAEVLSDPDDEIVFVDYNTPDELPTFVEALADTLTDRCLDLLRVLRVPAAVHERRFASRTHLPAIEPVARNAGVRRANPSNRWLLSTNTDMIFVPRAEESLSDLSRKIADGFYGMPRFELPEWLWERLPRSEPARAIDEIERLGPSLRLDEPTVSHEWIRFDAPGDFQLILRDDLFAIDGLDEEMLLGYHVDSNLSRRMLFHRGSIESLGDSLAGYHCNHNRERTVYHGAQIVTNDLERFVVKVERAELPAQRDSWGLVDEPIEEVDLRERVGMRIATALSGAIPSESEPRAASDAARVPFELTYDSGHVLPFVVDALAVSASGATVGYVGANHVLEGMLAAVVAELWFEDSLQSARLDDLRSVEELAIRADILVVDLGIDASAADSSLASPGPNEPARIPGELFGAFDVLERLVDLERARLDHGERPTRFVLVHSWTVFWDAFVTANFDCSHTTAHSRVRRATVTRVPADDGATRSALARQRRLLRWATRGEAGPHRLPVPARGAVELGRLHDYEGFGDGWAFPEVAGIWTQGRRSGLALALEGDHNGDRVLAFALGSICVAPGSSLSVAAFVNGERVAARDFRYGDPEWHIELRAAGSEVDLAFEVEDPQTPRGLGWSDEDDRPLGILLRSIRALRPHDEAAKEGLARERRARAWAARREDGRLRLPLSEPVQLAEIGDYGGFGDGWAFAPDQAGVWTEGSQSELAFAVDGIRDGDYALTLLLGSVCVSPEEALKVESRLNGEPAGTRELRHGDAKWRIESPAAMPANGEVDLTFIFESPRSPRELGWSDDDRRLGIRLEAITLEEIHRSVPVGGTVAFGEGSGAERLLLDGWSALEAKGVWTDGPQATLALTPAPARPGDLELVLEGDPFVLPEHPELTVEAIVRGEKLGGRTFRHRRGARLLRRRHPPLRVVVPAAARDDAGRLALELRLREPARPVDLGLSSDDRSLGFRLRSLTVREG